MNFRHRSVWMTGIALFAIPVILLVWSRFFAPPPHIVVITLDTTRADRLGCYGYTGAETPHLDRLASRGLIFDRAYAPAPMTAPSHSSMFTGLWPAEHGVVTNGQTSLSNRIPTVAEILNQAGYDTAAFVSSFVLQARFGLNRGFDHYDDDLSTADRGGDELHRSRDGKLVIQSAIDWLTQNRKHSTKPVFCWVHLYDPHEPYIAHPDEFGSRFDEQLYDGEIAYTDRLVGRLLQTLEELGISRNTCILVVGDHGESLGEHGELTHGYMLHESTLRVPLIMVDPRFPSVSRHVTQPVPLVDVFPTLLEAAQVSLPAGTRARSVRPAFSGTALEPRTVYSATDEPYLQAYWSPLRGLTTQRWRYVRTTRPELYDLTADPRELVNLAESQPETVRDLDNEMGEFEESLLNRAGIDVRLSAQDRRALESLGYTGGQSRAAIDLKGQKELPDIKDMIAHLNRLDEALHFIEQRNYDEASILLEPLARDVPNFFRARLNLGLCRLMQKNYDDARFWLQQALEIDPSSDRAHDMLGFTYLKLLDLESAEHHFQELLKLRPDSENGNLFLGEVYQRKGNATAAMHYYLAAQRINPRNRAAREAVETLREAMTTP